MSRNYSESGIFKYLRKRVFKIQKPVALPWTEWKTWREKTQSEHPLGYFVTEILPDYLEKPAEWFIDPIYNLKYYINNRWVTRTHALTAHKKDIKPGTWCDFGDRILYCMFNELVNFVEVEQAWHNVIWDAEARKKFRTPWWAQGWFRWRTWRSAESGQAYLDWASKLIWDESQGVEPNHSDYGKPTYQALAAREILDLYHWWKTVRPARSDPMKASGWNDYCEKRRQKLGPDEFFASAETAEEQAESKKMLSQMQDLEQQYLQEDEQMLIRLICIRNHLWT